MMFGGGGAAIIFVIVMVIGLLGWIRVIVAAGKWGAASGKRKRAETEVVNDRIRGLDVSGDDRDR